MEYITLSNGVKMPQLGYGVYWMRWRQDIAVLILPRAILMRRKWEKRLKSQGSIGKKYF